MPAKATGNPAIARGVRIHMSGLALVALSFSLYSPALRAEWGTTVNSLRLSLELSTANNGERHLTVTMENTEDRREMFVVLGLVGVLEAEMLQMHMVGADGKREKLIYRGGNGVAPGRLIPMIVPMLPGSTYSIRTPLKWWLRPDMTGLPPGATVEAEISVSPDADLRYVDCFGLRIFWSGTVRSAPLRIE